MRVTTQDCENCGSGGALRGVQENNPWRCHTDVISLNIKTTDRWWTLFILLQCNVLLGNLGSWHYTHPNTDLEHSDGSANPAGQTHNPMEWPKGRDKVPKELIRSPISPHPNLISIRGMCRNKPDSTHRVHCQCPNAGHHRTPLVVLLLCLNVFQLLWRHKENVHDICFLLPSPSIMKRLWITIFCIMTRSASTILLHTTHSCLWYHIRTCKSRDPTAVTVFS